MSGIGFMELLIIFTLLLIPILLLVFLLTRNRLRMIFPRFGGHQVTRQLP